MSKITVIGCGTWGCALANLLFNNGNNVTLYSPFTEEINFLKTNKKNKNLPNMTLSDEIVFTSNIQKAICPSEILIMATPSVCMRDACISIKPYIDNQIIVNVSKGLENETLYTMSEVIHSVLPDSSVVVLSGPTHAEEVAMSLPTTIVSACQDIGTANRIADLFTGSCMKAYTNWDVRGVEICAAFKNVIALACGVASGLGYGDNMRAAIITRGMNEISRLGKAMGCVSETFCGLAGFGDLVVTATSEHSRNNCCGKLIGQGCDVKTAVEKVGMVVEGLNALIPAVKLAKRYNVRMSIVSALNDIVNNGKSAKEAFTELMNKPVKSEFEKTELEIIYEENILKNRRNTEMKRIITYGTFDLLHYGHINLLKRAKALGDYLIVCLSTDEFNWNEKQKKCYFSYEQRKALLEALRYVDLVIPETCWDQKKTDIHEYHADVFVMGDDWKGKFDFLKDEGVEVVYLPRTPEISTTQIKNDLHK